MGYAKRALNKIKIQELFYVYGDTDNFDKFRGSDRFLLNKKADKFSNDRCLEIDGETKDGNFIDIYVGLGKAKHKFTSNMIGDKK